MAEKYYNRCKLDRYTLAARVCKRSKPWWNEEIKEQRKIAGRTKRLWIHSHVQWEKLKEEEKTLYRTIRKHKRRYWDKWKQTVEGKDVWKAVRCTREREGRNIPTLEGPRNKAVTIEEK
jgi:hypothetical protein